MYLLVGKDGQVTLPRELLQAANAKPGDLVEGWVTGTTEIVLNIVICPPMDEDEWAAVLAAREEAPSAPVGETVQLDTLSDAPAVTVEAVLAQLRETGTLIGEPFPAPTSDENGMTSDPKRQMGARVAGKDGVRDRPERRRR